MKAVIWLAGSKTDWDAFPASVKANGGYQIDKLQRGESPNDWKPMPSIGPGVREIRLRETSGAYRVIYLATRPQGVYILHVFQKKTPATPAHDIRLARERFQSIAD